MTCFIHYTYFHPDECRIGRDVSLFYLLKGGAGALFVTTTTTGDGFVNMVTTNGKREEKKPST